MAGAQKSTDLRKPAAKKKAAAKKVAGKGPIKDKTGTKAAAKAAFRDIASRYSETGNLDRLSRLVARFEELTALQEQSVSARAVEERDEILKRVEVWAGSPEVAVKWYDEQTIPSLGNKTAKELVNEGRASTVRKYLDRIAFGGYA